LVDNSKLNDTIIAHIGRAVRRVIEILVMRQRHPNKLAAACLHRDMTLKKGQA
jgi:hypothetical protein